MTINEYQNLAMRTANVSNNMLMESALGLAGEAGECVDIIKKHLCQDHPLDRDSLLEELGDLAWYIALCATVLDADLEGVLWCNIQKLKERYPDGFDAECSINRSDDITVGRSGFEKTHGKYISKAKAAKLLGVTRCTIYNMVKDGRLKMDDNGSYIMASSVYTLLNMPNGGLLKNGENRRNRSVDR